VFFSYILTNMYCNIFKQVGYVENSTTIKTELCEGPISSSDLGNVTAFVFNFSIKLIT